MLVPKEDELVADVKRYGGRDTAKEHFETGMLRTFKNIRRFVRDDFPLTVYYAFKQQDAGFLRGGVKGKVASTGWETMLSSLIQAGFSIVGTWPMRTEARVRPRSIGSNALASSIVLVCEPRPGNLQIATRREFQTALERELG